MQYLIALLILGVCILFHEFGHFLLARLNGITVLEFAMGMGPVLFKHKSKKSGTVYAFKLLPFGGSCSMLGEDEDDTQPGSFLSKNVWQRISVVAAGPVFNFILAFFCGMIVIGIAGFDPARVTEVESGSPAAQAGLQTGDRIVRYEGNGISSGRELYADISIDGVPDDEITLTYEHEGKKKTVTYVPVTSQRYLLGFSYSADGQEVEITSLTPGSPISKAGVQIGDIITGINNHEVTTAESLISYLQENPLDGSPVDISYTHNGKERTASQVTPDYVTEASLGFSFNLAREKTGFFGTIKDSFSDIGYWIHVTWKSLLSLVTGKFSINDMSGPVGVVSTIGDAYKEAAPEGALVTFLTMMNMLVLITANLGVMNLLPLPALDGGRLLFMVIEVVRRKPVNRELEGRVHFAGLMILLGFMVYITIHDIWKLF
ncbi:MAG: RIP metalloprotease RseP [Eubacterium sp.]|nr:RIP metalloprotease RseP [Eubacterium sp.]